MDETKQFAAEDTSDPTLYTDRELSMHVQGPKGFCDLTILRNYGDPYLSLEEAQLFYEDGYFKAPDLVSLSLITHARLYINSQYHNWLKISKRQDDWRIHLRVNFDELSTSPVEHAPLLNLLLQSPGILQRLDKLMNAKPVGCFYNQVAYRTPLKNYKPSILEYTVGAEYHIDGNANATGTRFPDPWSILVGIALVDIETTEMGNFTVFPGFHAQCCWKSYPLEKKMKELPSLGEPKKVCLKAGSVVFVHVLLPHRGGKNILTPKDVEASGINYDNLTNIPKATREMVLFRIRGEGIPYEGLSTNIMLLMLFLYWKYSL